MKNALVIGVAVVSLVVSVFALSKPGTEIVREIQAGGASDSFSFPVRFDNGLTEGGKVFATSSVAAATLTASNLLDVTLIQNSGATVVTMTLPASSTFSRNFIPRAGDTKTIFAVPTTANITFAGGTGTDLNSASSTKACVAGTLCRLEFVRKANTDIEVLLSSSTGI
jgi:hypothetical protein